MKRFQEITTSVSTFANLREGNFLYVDKTAHIRELLRPAFAQYFLARPRRFGKSLTLTTLKAIFEGRRDLFKGLAIDSSDYDWRTYPVLRLDMGPCQAATVEELREFLSARLALEADRLGVEFRQSGLPSVCFTNLVTSVAKTSPTGKCVILIDEYDKPLLGHLGKADVAAFRDELKPFYGVVKYTEELQRFAFVTGVSKFSKVSVFSDLNNLTDLTLSASAATLVGYTHDEVKRCFAEHVAALAETNGMTVETAYERLFATYNGYRFHAASETVVNPVSLGRCLADREFRRYWYETGTPTFLVEALRRQPIDLSRLTVDEAQLETYEPSAPALVPLLFQTGYLTICSMEQLGMRRIYTLDFPNAEVRDAFNSSLASVYTGGDELELGNAQLQCVKALMAHDLEAFREALMVFFANIPYTLTDRGGEQVFQAILYTVLRFIGVCVEAEVVTNRGRVDATVETGREVYVIEIKLDHTAEDALEQIKRNGYAEKYRASGRRITLMGLAFSSERRTIVGWKTEET